MSLFSILLLVRRKIERRLAVDFQVFDLQSWKRVGVRYVGFEF